MHSILLFKVRVIRVHLHVLKKMQLQSSKFCMCATSAEKLKNVTCVSLFCQATSQFLVQGRKYGGVGRGIESKKEHVHVSG